MRPALSPRQRDVLVFIGAYVARHGYPPSVREIADGIGVASPNAVNDHLDALESKGWVRRTRGVARGLVVIRQEGLK